MVIPENTVLGNLKIITVYDYYDCPMLFSCKSIEGKYYMALSVEDRIGIQLWFYVAVSSRRLASIEANKIELYDVFKKAEDHYVFGVRTGGKEDTVEIVICDDIPDKFLPEKGQLLNINEGKM